MIKEINLEEGLPPVAEALDRLNKIIKDEYDAGKKVIKLIHGYGSTGKGGKIRLAVRRELELMKEEGYIVDYCCGEHFEPFTDAGRKVLLVQREAGKDSDYARYNHGITLVVLRER